jgi:hypothetical protein
MILNGNDSFYSDGVDAYERELQEYKETPIHKLLIKETNPLS